MLLQYISDFIKEVVALRIEFLRTTLYQAINYRNINEILKPSVELDI